MCCIYILRNGAEGGLCGSAVMDSISKASSFQTESTPADDYHGLTVWFADRFLWLASVSWHVGTKKEDTQVSFAVERRGFSFAFSVQCMCKSWIGGLFTGCMSLFLALQLQHRCGERGAPSQHGRPKSCHSLLLAFILLGSQCLLYICFSWTYWDFSPLFLWCEMLGLCSGVKCVRGCHGDSPLLPHKPWLAHFSVQMGSVRQGLWTQHVLWGQITRPRPEIQIFPGIWWYLEIKSDNVHIWVNQWVQFISVRRASCPCILYSKIWPSTLTELFPVAIAALPLEL